MITVQEDMPEVLIKGLEAYKEFGMLTAVQIWASGSAHNISRDLREKIESLVELELAYGKFVDYSIENVEIITTTIHFISVSFSYKKASVPTKFLAYKNSKGWILANFMFSNALRATRAFLL